MTIRTGRVATGCGATNVIDIHIDAAWVGIGLGLLSGTAQGLGFHRDNWLGGYTSWPRRMLRLGHISFFGIAFLNLAYAQTLFLRGAESASPLASWLLIGGAVAMPTVCYLSAWRRGCRQLFFIPVVCLLSAAGVIGLQGVVS